MEEERKLLLSFHIPLFFRTKILLKKNKTVVYVCSMWDRMKNTARYPAEREKKNKENKKKKEGWCGRESTYTTPTSPRRKKKQED